MKKIILLITVLFVSVISTACINNLAVQELNSKAQEYMEAGDIEKAICRLRSSIDLDANVFESHYNLGVALISAKQYDEAAKSLENAIKLKPDFADSYYSLAVAQEELAYKKINKKAETEDSSEDIQTPAEQSDDQQAAEPSENDDSLSNEDKKEISDNINSAIENYNTYLIKKPDAEDKEKIENQINALTDELKNYSPEEDTPAEQ